MTVDTTTLVRQMLEALRQIDAALDPDDWAGDLRMMDITGPAIAAADAWLAQQPTNQCGEVCERAKVCAVCARGLKEGAS